MGDPASDLGSGGRRTDRDRERRDRFIARYSHGLLLRFPIITMMVNAVVAGTLGLLLDGWSTAATLFVLWSTIEFIARWWAVRAARRASESPPRGA